VGAVGDGEPGVGDPDLQEAAGDAVGIAERGRQPPEPVGGDRGQQPGLVAEVVGRGGVRHPGATGQVPQAERGRTDLVDRLDGGVEQDPGEVAMVVEAGDVRLDSAGHAATLARI
jgi:hypothetical protein